MQILNEQHEEGLETFLVDFVIKRFTELEDLKTNLSINNFNSLKSYAHNWKGFARPFGFIKLEELAIDLEESAKNQDKAHCDKLLIEIEIYLKLKKEAIALTLS
jgi:HPt (histidine-containing phosphotransfer) domain-containing protein